MRWREPQRMRAVCAAICLLGVASLPRPAKSADNPFGLPQPKDNGPGGTVMLHGGGHFFADNIRLEFARLAGGKDARIVLMPSDSFLLGKDADGQPLSEGESISSYERRMAGEYDRWIGLRERGEIADFQFIYKDSDDPNDSRLIERLKTDQVPWSGTAAT